MLSKNQYTPISNTHLPEVFFPVNARPSGGGVAYSEASGSEILKLDQRDHVGASSYGTPGVADLQDFEPDVPKAVQRAKNLNPNPITRKPLNTALQSQLQSKTELKPDITYVQSKNQAKPEVKTQHHNPKENHNQNQES